jgi:hypothetical protein
MVAVLKVNCQCGILSPETSTSYFDSSLLAIQEGLLRYMADPAPFLLTLQLFAELRVRRSPRITRMVIHTTPFRFDEATYFVDMDANENRASL